MDIIHEQYASARSRCLKCLRKSRLISIFNVRTMLTIFLRAVFSLSAFSSFPISSNAKYCVDLSLLQKGGFVATQNMLLSVTSLRSRIVQQLFLAVLARHVFYIQFLTLGFSFVKTNFLFFFSSRWYYYDLLLQILHSLFSDISLSIFQYFFSLFQYLLYVWTIDILFDRHPPRFYGNAVPSIFLVLM